MPFFQNLFPQFRFLLFKQLKVTASAKVLDFGCGKPGPILTKHWLPDAIYHGADIYDIGPAKESCQSFHQLEPNSKLPETFTQDYDLVIANHVVEHLANPLETIQWLGNRVRPNGILYLAFPSPRSIELPSAKGTLNFSDDPTHIWLPDPIAISNLLMANGFRIEKAGLLRTWILLLLGAAILPIALIQKAIFGTMHARGLWDIFGFEYHIAARKYVAMDPNP